MSSWVHNHTGITDGKLFRSSIRRTAFATTPESIPTATGKVTPAGAVGAFLPTHSDGGYHKTIPFGNKIA